MPPPYKYIIGQIFCWLLLSFSIMAQVPAEIEMSFRLYTSEGKIISPYEFERSVELYVLSPNHHSLIHQKRLLFDDRSYHFLFQTDQSQQKSTQLLLIHKEDTLLLNIPVLDTEYLVLDEIVIQQGVVELSTKKLQPLEGTCKPAQQQKVYRAAQLEVKKHKQAVPLKGKKRIRFSNYMEILHSRQ